MSDQPGIPAITVFPPFNPAQRQAEPAPQPVRDQAPPAAEPEAVPEETTAPRAAAWDAAAPAAPMPWDFEAPGASDQAATPAGEPRGVGDEEDDLPWLEVPAPEPEAEEEIKADESPNWMDWVRAEDQAAGGEGERATPVEELSQDAQPWAPEVEAASDAWQPPAEPWKAPEAGEAEEPRRAPDFHLTQPPAADEAAAPAEPEAEGEFQLPEPELYDLPHVEPAASAPAEAPAPETAEGPEAEPAWELPAADQHAGTDTPPAWESFGAGSVAAAEEAWTAPEAASEPTPAAQPAGGAETSSAFVAVADRLQAIADALRSDPAAFLAGAQGGGDPLGLLVAGFVLGYNARQGGNS
jgi:nicotinate-nucleotide--dimethylbenzimidazole phosphoribosyltransferase